MDVVHKTINRAIKASQRDGRLRFILPTALGPKISLKRWKHADCYWTNGNQFGFWAAGKDSGEVRGTIAA